MKHPWFLLSVFFVLVFGMSIFFHLRQDTHSQNSSYPGQTAHSNQEMLDEVKVLVNRLCTENVDDRQTAKSKLSQLGSKAIPPLISILEKKKGDTLPNCLTLEGDIIDLLGQLHAEEAIPILIRRMSTDGVVLRKKNEEIKALIQIGKPAVPKLLEVIETSDEKLASPKYWLGEDYVETNTPQTFRFIPHFIKTRAIMVLGKIGDSHALLTLERLLESENDSDVIETIQEAIKRIQRAK